MNMTTAGLRAGAVLVTALAFTVGGSSCRPAADARAERMQHQGGITMDAKVKKTDKEWRETLTPEQYRILREKGTERAFTGKYYEHHGTGVYACAGCGAELFRSDEKFDSGCGWPSFWNPADSDAVVEKEDNSFGMRRIEVLCARCGGHLGHVFPDGPKPTGLRYCINSGALDFTEKPAEIESGKLQTATFGAGCFWCTEAAFESVEGVKSVAVGYMGGATADPTYKEVCTGRTGHAEVAQVEYDPHKVSFEELLDVFWKIHDPTSLNRQGADVGTQYRSAIFYHSEEQKSAAEKAIEDIGGKYSGPIVTEVAPASTFYKAEEYHQDYYRKNPDAGYCRAVIAPKLEKLK